MEVPRWLAEPKSVWIRCQHISAGQRPDEFIVQFKVNGDEFTAFVPKQFVDQSTKTLAGCIVADYEDSWLIDIPVETLTSGPRIFVPDAEKESVVVLAK